MRSAPMLKTETMTTTNGHYVNRLDEQVKWREKSKSELIETSRVNMLKRLSKIMDKVNDYDPLFKHFEISKVEIRRMFSDVDDAIHSWRGVDITSCKKQKNSFKAYKVTATNWFNRNKAKIYGNYFFFPLIFKHLLNHCQDIKGTRSKIMTDTKRMELFIELFLQIFGGKITFARTKAQPLLPYQTLIQPNEFRNKCKELITFYDLEWNQNAISPSKVHRIYQKDKCRSHKIFDSFIKCLKSIQNKLLLSHDDSEKYGFFRLQAQSLAVEIKKKKNEMKSEIVMHNLMETVADNRLVANYNYNPYINNTMNPLINNGLSPNINQMINAIAAQDDNNNIININMVSPQSIPIPLNNYTNIQMQMHNNLNLNANFMNNNDNNSNGIRIRYQLLSIHPQLPPIVISQNVV